MAARLEKLTENAERVMAVPRHDYLELQIRRCEEYIDRIKEVVIGLCEFQGIPPIGLGPAPIRPPLDQLPSLRDVCVNIWDPRHRHVGVGTHVPEVVNTGVGTNELFDPAEGQISVDLLRTLSPPPPSPPAPRQTAALDIEMSAAPLLAASLAVTELTGPNAAATVPEASAPPVLVSESTHNSEAGPSDSTSVPSVPPVNLIGPTPDNSQEERAAGLIPIPPSPPPPQSAPLLGPPPSQSNHVALPGSQDASAIVPSAAAIRPLAGRRRSRTPNLALLPDPGPVAIRTRSRTRSPSPMIMAGEKRKADEKSDGDGGPKKRKM